MNEFIHGGVLMEPNSKSTKEPSHHHNITKGLPTMDLCDGNLGNYHKQSNGAGNFVLISILFISECGKIVSYNRRILRILNEHICTIEALQPDVLPQSEYLSVYATFKSHIAYSDIKTRQKQVHTALQKSKTHASSMATQILWVSHTGGLHPLWQYLGDHPSVVDLRHHDSNTGQITLDIEIKTIDITVFHKPGQYVFTGISFLMRILS